MDSLIRIKQLQQQEVFGYIVDVIQQYLSTGTVSGIASNTGQLVNQFYPLRQNPSGYITSGQTGVFATRGDVSGNNAAILSSLANYYPRNNPSGFTSVYGAFKSGTNYYYAGDGPLQIIDIPNGVTVFEYVPDDYLNIASPNQKSVVSFSFDPYISGFTIYATGINGKAVITSGDLANYVPWSMFGQSSVGFGNYFALKDSGKSVSFVFSTGKDYYFEGRHAKNVSEKYIMDMYGSKATGYGVPSGQPFLYGFHVYTNKVNVSGYDVLTTRDITQSGLVLYPQLTGVSGTLNDADGRLSTRINNSGELLKSGIKATGDTLSARIAATGSYLYHLTTGITGVGGGGGGTTNVSGVVYTSGTQTISGAKTFSGTAPQSLKFAKGFVVGPNGEYATFGDDGLISFAHAEFAADGATTFVDGNVYINTAGDIKSYGKLAVAGHSTLSSVTGTSANFTSLVIPTYFDSSSRSLITDTNNPSINWNDGSLFSTYDSSTSLDWSARWLADSSVNIALDWENRQLITSNGTSVALDWNNRILSGAWTLNGQPITGGGGSVDETYLVHRTGDEVISGHKIFASGIRVGDYLIDTNAGTLGLSASAATLDWKNSYLQSKIFLGTYYPSIDWQNRIMYDAVVQSGLDWGGRQLLNSSSKYTLNWQNHRLYDSNEKMTLDWNTRMLTGHWRVPYISGTDSAPYAININSGILSGNWNAQNLFINGKSVTGYGGTTIDESYLVHKTGEEYVSGRKFFGDSIFTASIGLYTGAVSGASIANLINVTDSRLSYPNYALDTSGDYILDASGFRIYSTPVTLDWAERILSGNWKAGGLTIDNSKVVTFANSTGFLTGYILKDSGSKTAINLNTRSLVYPDGSTVAIDWVNGLVYDTSASESFNWGGRYLTNNTYDIYLDWQNGYLYDQNLDVSLDWNAKTLRDTNSSSITVDWSKRILSGNWTAQNLFINGKSVTGGGSVDETYLVHRTGVEIISGQKTFANEGILSGNWEIGTIRGLSGYFQTGLNVVGRVLQGSKNTAPGDYSHAEGFSTQSYGLYSHAEGGATKSLGAYSHAEGLLTIASGSHSHAEGLEAVARGTASHAQGYQTLAYGDVSFAVGKGTIASGDYQSVFGNYNIPDTSSILIIGNGVDAANRSNVVRVIGSGFNIDGNLIVSGALYSASKILSGDWTATNLHVPNKLNTTDYTLYSGNTASLDWLNKYMFDYSYIVSQDWGNRLLINSDGDWVVNWENTTLNDGFGQTAINWNNRAMYDTVDAQTVDWAMCKLYDGVSVPSPITSLDWSQRILSGVWTTNNLSVNSLLAVKEITNDLVGGDVRIDVSNRQLLDSQPTASLDWENYKLYANGTEMVNWYAGTLSGNWDVQNLTSAGKKLPFVAKYSNITGTRTGSYDVFTANSSYVLNSLKIETVRSSGIFTNSGFAFNFSGSRNEIVIDNTRIPIYSSGLHSGRFISYSPDLFANIISGGSVVRFNITSGATGLANGLNIVNVYAEGFYT